MHKQEVGHRLRMACEALGLQPATVARRFGVSPSKLGNWLAGRDYPNEFFIYRFCTECQVSADWLYLGRVSGMASGLADSLWGAAKASSGPESVQAHREGET